MLGAIPRLFWNSSNRVSPCSASRTMSMLHHSPTRSRLRAIGHGILPKLLRCIDTQYRTYYHDASYYDGRPAMGVSGDSDPNSLFLDDLHVGQRFASGSHTIDEAQIKAFAAQFDPQPFHTDD